MLAAALEYAARGWPVFPCRSGAKAPATPNGNLNATTDPDAIRKWWGRRPDWNVAIRTGAPAVDVLDVDVRAAGNGWAGFNQLKAAGLLSGAVSLVRTPSGGLHAYFPGTDAKCSSLRGRFIDFKALGGYVLAPPSYVVADDYEGRYELLDQRAGDGKPFDWETARSIIDPRPAQWSTPAPLLSGSIDPLVRWVSGLGEGGRNAGLFWAACRAAETGHDPAALRDAALSTGLPAVEVDRTIRSAQRRVGAA